MSIRSQIADCKSIDASFRLSTGEITTSRTLLNGLVDDLESAFEFIPNSMLPKRLHGHKEFNGYSMVNGEFEKNYGRPVKDILKDSEEQAALIDEENCRLSNLSAYCDQIPAMGSPEQVQFREDERRLNNAQVNFLKLLHQMGKVDEKLDLVTA
jgi:hypothetical protein